MAYEENLVCVTRPAGADLSGAQYHVVQVDAAGDVILATQGDLPILGILQNNPADTQAATVAISGISKVHTMAAADEAVRVGVGATDGQVEVAGTGDVVVGTVVESSGAANDIASISINIGDEAIA